MDILKKVIAWLVFSSKNPNNFSLTLKGLIPFLVLINVGDAETLGIVVDAVINVLVLTATWVTGFMTAYGAIRKVYLSFVRK